MNKNLISQLVISICAILLIATVTFAWFAISNTADAGFVAQVGDLESSFEFAAVQDDSLVSPEGNQLLDMKDVIPGQKFFFIMNIQAAGGQDGNVSIMLNDIKSYNVKYLGNGTEYSLEETYENRYDKIQYAFRYSITGAYWVPHGTSLDKELNQSNPLGDIPDAWVPFNAEEQANYYPRYDEPKTEEDEGGVRFNHLEETSTNDQDDYVLLENVPLKGNLPSNSNNAFVVIFEVEFTAEPVFPQREGFDINLPSDFDSTYSNRYELQLFSISNVTIITSKED